MLAITRRTHTDAAHLCQTQLCLVDVRRQLQDTCVRIVVDQPHVTHAQSIVDVVDVTLNILVDLLEVPRTFLLMVERLHHFRDITACHKDTRQLSSLVSDGVDSRLIIHLPAKVEVTHPIAVFSHLAEVYD